MTLPQSRSLTSIVMDLIAEGEHQLRLSEGYQDSTEFNKLAEEAKLALAALSETAFNIPKGWKLVPEIATLAMLEAAGHACDGMNLSKLTKVQRSRHKAHHRYLAMLEAAPQPTNDPTVKAGAAFIMDTRLGGD